MVARLWFLQATQALDVPKGMILDGHLRANSECSLDIIANGCSHNAESGEDITPLSVTALVVTCRKIGS